MLVMHGTEGFRDRTNAIFAALDADVSRTWTLAEHQVFKAGRDADYSSDEDRAAAQRESEIPSNLFFEGTENDEGQRVMPSDSFCRALDAEPEMDANDAVAEGVSLKREKRPLRTTEVPDSRLNFPLAIESRKCSDELRRQSSDELSRKSSDELTRGKSDEMDLDVDIPMPQSSPTREESLSPGATTRLRLSMKLPQTSAVMDAKRFKTKPERSNRRRSEGDEKPKRRVRFGDTVEMSDSRPEPITRHMSGNLSSYVPDHVKNPQKYTEYVLDTPITVGSGNDGSEFPASTSNNKDNGVNGPENFGSEMSETNLESENAILFKPSSKKGRNGKSIQKSSADRINKTSLSLQNGDVEDKLLQQEISEAEAMDLVGSGFRSTSNRNRNLRSTSRS